MKIFVVIAILLGVSAHAAESAVGHYVTLGFSSSRVLDLCSDGSFQLVLRLTEGAGEKKEVIERESWKLSDGIVVLRPEGERDYADDVWYARLFFRKKDGVRVLLCAVKGAWAYEKYGFEEELNQPPYQPPQRNAGSHPSSDDSPASETPSSLGSRDWIAAKKE